ncbi:N-acetyltransferase [Beijerinckiaceae bacterium]|nr:N-acetyltransferase [Beijerinckiaceae bacterium]
MYLAQQTSCDHAFSAFNTDAVGKLSVTVAPDSLSIRKADREVAAFRLDHKPTTLVSIGRPADTPNPETENILLAAIEALFARDPDLKSLRLQIDAMPGLRANLIAAGIALDRGKDLEVAPEMFWQLPAPWLAKPAGVVFPQIHVMTEGKRHPLRPQKPKGLVYARFIPWLDQVLSFRALDPTADLECFNKWMNDPQVDKIWEEGGDLDRHRAYLQKRIADSHMLPLIGCFDDQPFAYFEIYWAKENRLGPYYDADDYDRGWHVAVGEPAFRGKAWITAWLPSLMHFMFLDDPRTQRIVGEPSAAHAQQIRNLERSGFAKIKHFDFPHKRALLVMLLRERYFGDRLWIPNERGAEKLEAPSTSPERSFQGEQVAVS